MRLLKTDKSGQVTEKEPQNFGGEYSTRKKIKLGGICSLKVQYEFGLGGLNILSVGI